VHCRGRALKVKPGTGVTGKKETEWRALGVRSKPRWRPFGEVLSGERPFGSSTLHTA